MRRLKSEGVRFATTTWARSIDERTVTLYDVHTDVEQTLDVDAAVLSTSRQPVDELARDLEGQVAQLFTIGDALAPRPLAAATYEGQKFARLIGETDAPATVPEAYFRADSPEMNPLPADVPRHAR